MNVHKGKDVFFFIQMSRWMGTTNPEPSKNNSEINLQDINLNDLKYQKKETSIKGKSILCVHSHEKRIRTIILSNV